MFDPYVTAEFTLRDLLTHRSGLGLGAGDLMFWPDRNTFTKEDIIHNLRYLKPVSSFRSKYDYNNLLYIVAGEVVARVSGVTWEKFIQTRFFDPMDIKTAAPSFKLLKDSSNVIDPHAVVDGQLKVITRDWSENANAAGGIYASVTDMSKWMLTLLNQGKYGDKQILSPRTLRELWTPQTLQPLGNLGYYRTHFAAYGLGWVLQDVLGYKQVSHTGGLAGIVTQTIIIPDIDLAILVYTNQQVGAAFTAISNTIKDSYLGKKGQEDWIKVLGDRVAASRQQANQILQGVEDEIQKNNNSNTSPNFNPTGIYSDIWFGDAEITQENGQFYFTSKRSHQLKGKMYYFKGDTYIVRWDDRSLDADAYLVFGLNYKGEPESIKVRAISPLTDFSFDFQDLDFKKKK